MGNNALTSSAILISFLHILFLQHSNCAITTHHPSICTQTPYPEQCISLIPTTKTPQTTNFDENLSEFFDISLKATLAQAQDSHELISHIDTTSFDELGKLAWADCVELYENSIWRLNNSLHSQKTSLDAQTWLSEATANVEACRNGFLDFNLSSRLEESFPHAKLSEFSKFLSNSLAITKNMESLSTRSNDTYYPTMQNKNRRLSTFRDDFPEWVSSGDRKLLQSSGASRIAHVVVAQDGSGDYRTMNEALASPAVKKRIKPKRFLIYVKKGIYRENVEIKRSMKNFMFIGDGIDATIVTGNRSVKDGSTTFRSATFAVTGDGFMARGITFENTAGPHKHQAVALRSGSDRSAFYQCSFKGYQDTLYAHSNRQFYRECDIYGTVDFIFGDAACVVQNSNVYIRRPMRNQKNTVTAQGRSDPNENTGIVIHNSVITASPELRPVQGLYQSYLGRPWKAYSRTMIMRCLIDGLIDGAGWLPWSGDFGLSTLEYGEYMNRGRGASTRLRVEWPGFRVITSPVVAGQYSTGRFLAGDSWIPATGVPYDSRV